MPGGGQEEAGGGQPLLSVHHQQQRCRPRGAAGQPLQAHGVDVAEGKALICWTARVQALNYAHF